MALLALGTKQSYLPYYFAANENVSSLLREMDSEGQASNGFLFAFGNSKDFSQILKARHPDLGNLLTRRLSNQILRLSYRYGFPPDFILALIETESNFRFNAVSPRGARGLMQIKSETARAMAESLNRKELNLDLPEENLELAVKYLADLRDRFKDPKYFLIAYNHGPSKLVKMIKSGQQIPDSYFLKVRDRFNKVRREGNLL